MKLLRLFIALCAACTLVSGLNGQVWERSYDVGGQIQEGQAIAASEDGHLFVAGRSMISTAAFELFLLKLDENGNPLWSRGYEEFGASVFVLHAIAGSGGQGVVVSGFTGPGQASQGFIAAFGPDGSLLWRKEMEGVRRIERLVRADKGDIFAMGGTKDESEQGLNAFLGYLARLRPDGTLFWEKVFPIIELIEDLAVRPDGGLILAGHQEPGFDPSTIVSGLLLQTEAVQTDSIGPISNFTRTGNLRQFERFESLILLNNGDMVCAGSYRQSALGGDAGIVTYRYSPGLGLEDFNYLSNPDFEPTSSLSCNDQVVFIGWENLPQGRRLMMLATGLEGEELWAEKYGQPGLSFGRGLTLSRSGNVTATGSVRKEDGREWVYVVQSEQSCDLVNSLRASGQKHLAVKVFPTLASEQVVFELPVSTSRNYIRLFSTSGNQVCAAEFEGANYTLQRRGLPPGVYFYRIDGKEGFATGKVVFR